MIVRDPTLFLSIYLHKRSRGMASVLHQLNIFGQKFGLEPNLKLKNAYRKASEIDLDLFDRSQSEFHVLAHMQSRDSTPCSGSFYDFMIYTYHDAIVIQMQNTRFQDWQGTFIDGYKELASEVRGSFDSACLTSAGLSAFGMSVVYWTIFDNDLRSSGYEDEIAKLSPSQEMDIRQTVSDLGLLWSTDTRFFENLEINQDLWVLGTSRNFEEQVNDRYSRIVNGDLPPFAKVALAHHKIFFEIGQHQQVRKRLDDDANVLDEETRRFLERQRELGAELDDLLSDRAVRFEQDLCAATNSLAHYRNDIGRLKELRRTIEVNRRNYVVACIQLLNENLFAELVRSREREKTALKILDGLTNDEVFGHDLGNIGHSYQQLDTDIGYADSVAERHDLSLRSGTDQLRIAGEKEIAEIARHMSIDSAAVVATLAAVVAIELVVRDHGSPKHMWESLLLIGWSILGGYGLTQALGSRLRGNRPGKNSIVAAFGLASGWMVVLSNGHPMLGLDHSAYRILIPIFVAAIAIGILLGTGIYTLAWRYAQRLRQKNLRRQAKSKDIHE
jgi:hypothetical protein